MVKIIRSVLQVQKVSKTCSTKFEENKTDSKFQNKELRCQIDKQNEYISYIVNLQNK